MHDRISGLLHLQAALDDRAMVSGHLNRAWVSEEVGRVEHVDVETVALDPLAAVQESAKVSDRAVIDGHAAAFSIARTALIW